MTRDILIEPRDPVLFRDGRPFSAGLGAESLGWPMPSAIAGQVRTRLWQPRSFQAPEFTDREKGQLLSVRQTGPFLACETEKATWELAFAAPADAVTYRGGSMLRIVPLRPLKEAAPLHGCDLPDGLQPLLGATEDKAAEDGPAFWTLAETLRWLQTRELQPWFRPDAHLGYRNLPEQSRIHVEIQKDKRNAVESRLFRTVSREFDFSTEFHPQAKDEPPVRVSRRAAIYSHIDGPDFGWSETSGAGPAGGERRIARWSMATDLLPPGPDMAPAVGLLRMQLVTPAIFGGGWKADWMTSGEPPGCPGLKLALVAAAIPRQQAVSGFDMTAKGYSRFKATRFCAPAGSVYFFRVTGGDPRQLWLKPVSDREQDRLDGFGIVLTGGWQWR